MIEIFNLRHCPHTHTHHATYTLCVTFSSILIATDAILGAFTRSIATKDLAIDCYRIVKSRIKFLNRGRVHAANCTITDPSRGSHFIHRFSNSFRRCVFGFSRCRWWIRNVRGFDGRYGGTRQTIVLRGELWDHRSTEKNFLIVCFIKIEQREAGEEEVCSLEFF